MCADGCSVEDDGGQGGGMSEETKARRRRQQQELLRVFEIGFTVEELDRLFDEAHKNVIENYTKRGFKVLRDVKVAPFLWRTDMQLPDGKVVGTDVQLFAVFKKRDPTTGKEICYTTVDFERMDSEQMRQIFGDPSWKATFFSIRFSDERDLNNKLRELIDILKKEAGAKP